MFYIRLRFLFMALCFIIGIALHVKFGIGSAWYLYLAGGIFLASSLFFGTVWAAFSSLQQGKIQEADMMLRLSKPTFLAKRHKAYYHFTKGMIALQNEQLSIGEKELEEALRLGLRTENDSALASLNLAHIAYKEKRWDVSRKYLDQAKYYKSDDLMIKDKVKELENALIHPYN